MSTACNNRNRNRDTPPPAGRQPACQAPGRRAAFTMVEVLAALLFMAIVIPVTLQALYVASLSGEVAARKSEAARVADRVLNEAAVTGNASRQSGTAAENGHPFRWTLRDDVWPVAAMQVLTVEVTYAARGRDYAVRLSTLAASPLGMQP